MPYSGLLLTDNISNIRKSISAAPSSATLPCAFGRPALPPFARRRRHRVLSLPGHLTRRAEPGVLNDLAHWHPRVHSSWRQTPHFAMHYAQVCQVATQVRSAGLLVGSRTRWRVPADYILGHLPPPRGGRIKCPFWWTEGTSSPDGRHPCRGASTSG